MSTMTSATDGSTEHAQPEVESDHPCHCLCYDIPKKDKVTRVLSPAVHPTESIGIRGGQSGGLLGYEQSCCLTKYSKLFNGSGYKTKKNRRMHHAFSFLNCATDYIKTTETNHSNGIPYREEN
jgi:hypothetical protein